MKCRLFPVLLASLLASLLAACSTTNRLPPVASGQTVSIDVARVAAAPGGARIDNQEIGRGAKTGAVAGTVVGGLSGLACGPFAFICIPGGMLLGAGTGAGGGAIVGLAVGLDADQAESLRRRVAALEASGDPAAALRARIAARLERTAAVVQAGADASVTIEWGGVQLSSQKDGMVALRVQVPVSLRLAPPKEPQRKTYVYEGPMTPLALWLDDASEAPALSLRHAVEQIAAQVADELLRP